MKTVEKKKVKRYRESLGLPVRVKLYSVGEQRDYKTFLIELISENLKNCIIFGSRNE